MLDVPIKIFKEVRDRCPYDAEETAMADESSNDGTVLVWDDDITKRLLGESRDCVWICEQCWNLALLVKRDSNWHGTKSDAAEFFAFAHDYMLMSNEEEGKRLTTGFLDSDNKNQSNIPDLLSHSFPCSEVSSEFSAQCLLMSTSALLDSLNFDESSPSDARQIMTDEFVGGDVFSTTTQRKSSPAADGMADDTSNPDIVNRLASRILSQRALWRVKMCKAEFSGNEINDPSVRQVRTGGGLFPLSASPPITNMFVVEFFIIAIIIIIIV